MCGIFFSASTSSLNTGDHAVPRNDWLEKFTDLCRQLKEANSLRGPDAQDSYRICRGKTGVDSLSIADSPAGIGSVHELVLDFYASELRLRGTSSTIQPHVKDDNVLCWNGEIFDGMEILATENDGARLFSDLCVLETVEEIRDTFGGIEGPYAFVFYHEKTRRIFFGRDPLGRRSLLIHEPTSQYPYLLLSSVSAGSRKEYDFQELSTDFIYCLDINALSECQDLSVGYATNLHLLPRCSSQITHHLDYAEPSKLNDGPVPNDIPLVGSLDNIPEDLINAVDDFLYHLDRSVMLRVRDVPRHLESTAQARVAVLFSGGIDSTILTFLANSHIPLEEPIDLLNVAFENPRKIRLQKEGNIASLPKRQKKIHQALADIAPDRSTYMVPDRVTGLKEVEELRRLCPGRIWNFVEINVPYQETQEARSTVEALMLPGRTVMDLSLALALYFAARGIGYVRDAQNLELKPYTSRARVLLNGLGSDELLGGYGRHRTAFSTGGWEAVTKELQLELDRIPVRNLGRDDRVISCHGKETRHPFLSLSVVNFLAALPVHYKVDPRAEVGVGDKMLLRFLARKVGLVEASSRKKRAMQFGSHSARMEGERRGDTIMVPVE